MKYLFVIITASIITMPSYAKGPNEQHEGLFKDKKEIVIVPGQTPTYWDVKANERKEVKKGKKGKEPKSK